MGVQIRGDLASLMSLSFIDMSSSHLQGSSPSSLFSISGQQSFLAAGNMITGELPDEFQDCPTLCMLDL
jgi:hypothetical protein